MTDGLVDVVVVTFNSAPVIADCLEPLVGHPAIRVTVVDNGSKDETLEIVERSKQVSLVSRPDNPGFGAACNHGAHLGSAEYLAFINPDVRTAPETLLSCAKHVEHGAGVVGCQLLQADGTLDHACKRMMVGPLGAAQHLFRPGRPSRYRADHLSAVDVGPVDAVNGAFMVLSRQLFDAIGGFDERFWMYGEDIDLCLRGTDVGRPTTYVGTESAIHLKSAGTGRARSLKLNYHFYWSAWLLYAKRNASTPIPLRALTGLGLFGTFLIAACRDLYRRSRGEGLPLSAAPQIEGAA